MAATAIALSLAASASADIISDSELLARFGIDRSVAGQVGSNVTYQFWDTFTDPGPNPGAPISAGNAPEPGANLNQGGTANLIQNVFNPTGAPTTGPFLTSGGNIYSFASQTGFDVDLPNLNAGTSFTRIVAQWQTLGTELDYDSIWLEIDDGVQGADPGTALAPTYTEFLSNSVNPGPFGGSNVAFVAVWDIAGNAAGYDLSFNSEGTSMSLDQFALDTFASTSLSAIQPAAIPEPSSMAFGALALLGGGAVRWRKKRREVAVSANV
ncbi:MAG: PEP-CTERM sorting domain-containing protein [Planctomycetota bacterium]